MTASTSEQAALIGGIYSNHLALEAALSDISSRNIGSIYCLGDLGAFEAKIPPPPHGPGSAPCPSVTRSG